MKISVDLQPPFKYNEEILSYFVILLIVLTVGLVLFYLIKKYRVQLLEIYKNIVKKTTKKNKDYYLNKLAELENDYKSKKIKERRAYFKISSLLREFVYFETDIKTHTFSLDELEHTNMPELYEIIKEIYNPEFAKYSEGDVIKMIKKVYGVIKKWNS